MGSGLVVSFLFNQKIIKIFGLNFDYFCVYQNGFGLMGAIF